MQVMNMGTDGLKDFVTKIERKETTIGIIGLGYVGLPLLMEFGEASFGVLGFDIDDIKIVKLKGGESYISYISSERIQRIQQAGRITVTNDFSLLSGVDSIHICVPTPLGTKREPDLSFVETTAREVARYLRRGQLIVLESTTYPGTTEELLLPIFEERGMRVGRDFYLAYSPEREDPGNRDYSIRTTPKVVGGITPACLQAATTLYGAIVENVVPVSSAKAAELTKLFENVFRSVNIALVNELKMLAERMGIDVWEVIEAAATKPFGFMPFYPGPGLGGHCIPIDPFYLSWKAKEYDFSARFIELSGEINTNMPYYVVGRTMEALNNRGKSLKGSKILILGITYKRDVGDLRESPALKIMELLQDKGAVVSYNDPFVAEYAPSHGKQGEVVSVALEQDLLSEMDCVLIATDHSSYDYQWIVDAAHLIIDTRNATRRTVGQREKIVKV
ncbi:MAG: nucleotide sugar dehydrogenase [Gemmatimonadota bacterium]|nr:MAG: nucleotide sugar dehydrogenase [Gemmatimonadota bacterium]